LERSANFLEKGWLPPTYLNQYAKDGAMQKTCTPQIRASKSCPLI
jgi:hypothetical protein